MDKKPKIISLPQSIDFIAEIVGNDLHAKRILSLAGAAVGVCSSTRAPWASTPSDVA